MQVLHKNSVLNTKSTIVPFPCPYMVNLLRFYETDASIYLLLQHASGGKLWNYISGYFQQHTDTYLDDVLDDIHERNLRTHKPSASSFSSLKAARGDTSSRNISAGGESVQAVIDVKSGKGTVAFGRQKSNTTADTFKDGDELCNRQESTTEVDSLLEDNHSIDQSKQKLDLSKSLSLGENATINESIGDSDSRNFFEVLKAADTSVKAFSINSFESEGDTGSRINSTTSEHGIESIPEVQSELSPSHAVSQLNGTTTTGEVFKPTADTNGAIDSIAQSDKCDDEKNDEDTGTYATIRAAEAAIESANKLLNEEDGGNGTVLDMPTSSTVGKNLVLPEVPKDNVKSSAEEVSIYDIHRSAESESESSSPERPSHLLLHKQPHPPASDAATPTPVKSRHGSSSSPKDPERTPVIYRMPSQERSLESEVRPRKRNLSSVFRDLDLAEGDVKTTVHLPEACVRQWAAEIAVALGYLHCLGIVCK